MSDACPQYGLEKDVAELTNNFALTFNQVKDRPTIQRPGLREVSIERVKEFIRNGRRKAIRIGLVKPVKVDRPPVET